LRYQRIFTSIWQDEKVLQLSEDGRVLFLYILTSPHSNSLGLYVLLKQYILGDLGWDNKRLDKPFAELISQGLIDYDEKNRLILVENHLKHNPIANLNQVKANVKLTLRMPKSHLYSKVIAKLDLHDKPFLKPLLERLKVLLPKSID
jgi:hypothetical protein